MNRISQRLGSLNFDKEERNIESQNNIIRLSWLIHQHQYTDKIRLQIVSDIIKIKTDFSKLILYLDNM